MQKIAQMKTHKHCEPRRTSVWHWCPNHLFPSVSEPPYKTREFRRVHLLATSALQMSFCETRTNRRRPPVHRISLRLSLHISLDPFFRRTYTPNIHKFRRPSSEMHSWYLFVKPEQDVHTRFQSVYPCTFRGLIFPFCFRLTQCRIFHAEVYIKNLFERPTQTVHDYFRQSLSAIHSVYPCTFTFSFPCNKKIR